MGEKKKLKKQIRKLTARKEISTVEQDRLFKEYSFDYSDEPNLLVRNTAVKLQRFVFDNLNERELENTAVEKLLDMTLEDIECQHTIKSGIENKAGFILALWGILISIVCTKENELLGAIKTVIKSLMFREAIFWVASILVVALILTGTISLYYIYKSIKPHTYKKFPFDSKSENFKSAAENKNITYTVLLDNVTNSWKQNRDIVNKLADDYQNSVKWIIAFAITIMISFIIMV